MGEREIVLSAIDAIIVLNRQAGASTDSLTALLGSVSEGRDMALFDKFCKEIMTCIHSCFSHFSKVLPLLAKTRAHRDFHQARMQTIPDIWLSFTSAADLNMGPHNLQAVSRHLFDHCMKNFFEMLKIPVATPQSDIRLLSDEENALRYASGYIGMKLLKKLRKSKGAKAAQFRECLSGMSRHGDDSTFYAYTTEWINTINRGGLFVINDSTFELFTAMEVKTRQLLPRHLAQLAQSNKEELIKMITGDETVQLKWRPVGMDIIDMEDSNELLGKIVGMWVTMRGFAMTSNWMEEYKRAKDKLVKKSKSLRKGLTTADPEDA